MASTTRNVSVLTDGGDTTFAGTTSTTIRDYSDVADTVDLTNTFPSNYHTRMLGGDDNVTLSNVNLGGYSNKVNGNLGSDTIESKAGSITRDFILGGSEGDRIDLSNSTSGYDWQNGNNGDDTIIGANSTKMSILRGGSENDYIQINAGSQHIAVGDLGKDTINLVGVGRVVCRTDNGAAAQNIGDTDRILNFDGAFDKAYIPGVGSVGYLGIQQIGGSTYLSSKQFTNGTTGFRYIAEFVGRTADQVRGYINGGAIIIGDRADNALAALTPSNFLNNPTLGGQFV